MKGLLAALVLFSAVFLLFGCASMQQQSGGNQGANAGGNNQAQGAGAGTITDKVILTGPSELPGGKVGKPYEYSYCEPKPKSKMAPCGGIEKTINPTGGKGPYTFYLGSGVGFPPFGLILNQNGILSGIPTAAGKRTFEVCAKDIGGDFDCDDFTLTVVEDAGPTGVWELTSETKMIGPEGSFPEGCRMLQKFQLNLTETGNGIIGVATNRLTRTTGCGIWSVDIATPDNAQVAGSFSVPAIKFSMGTTDYSGTLSWGNMNGTVETCHSPDARCSASGLQLLNWYSGNFTATKVG